MLNTWHAAEQRACLHRPHVATWTRGMTTVHVFRQEARSAPPGTNDTNQPWPFFVSFFVLMHLRRTYRRKQRPRRTLKNQTP